MAKRDSEESLDFLFKEEKNRQCKIQFEEQGVSELSDLLDEYVAYGGLGKEKETFRLELDRNMFSIVFDPWTIRCGMTSRKQ